MNIAVVCQPDAHSAPKCERAAASSSTWKRCGSKTPRESLDLVGRESVPAELRALADPHVFEESHAAGARAPGSPAPAPPAGGRTSGGA